jgi:hypothetical protein
VCGRAGSWALEAWVVCDVGAIRRLAWGATVADARRCRCRPRRGRSFVWTVKGSDYEITKEDFEERNKVDMSNVRRIKVRG